MLKKPTCKGGFFYKNVLYILFIIRNKQGDLHGQRNTIT